MIEAGPRLCESLGLVGIMVMQHDHQLPGVVREHLACATLMRYLQLVSDVEDLLIPCDAAVEVAHGQRDVMDTRARRTWHSALLVAGAM